MLSFGLNSELGLRVELVLFEAHNCGAGVPCLPGRLANELDGTGLGVVKDVRDLLEGLVGRLGEHEEHVPEHAEAEDSKQDVGLPGDVCKCGWHKVGKGKVERPVSRGRERNSLATNAQREQLWWVGPGDGTPSGRVGGDKQVGARDERLCGRAGDGHGLGI